MQYAWGKKTNACRVLVGKAEGKIPPGTRKHRQEDNIKTDFGEIR
jgi:hypothetical protein